MNKRMTIIELVELGLSVLTLIFYILKKYTDYSIVFGANAK